MQIFNLLMILPQKRTKNWLLNLGNRREIPENRHPGNCRFGHFLHSPHLKIETSRSINSLACYIKQIIETVLLS